MEHSLGRIAEELKGELIGSEDLLLNDITFLDEADPSQITFAINKSDFQLIELDDYVQAGAVIVPEHYNGSRTNIVKVNNMQLAIARTIALFYPKKRHNPEISSQAYIHPNATLGKDAYIESFVHIGANTVIGDRAVIRSGVHISENVVIGEDVDLFNRVIIMPKTQIGNRVVIQPGTLIGGEGFGYAKDEVELVKIPHIGNVVIEDDVDIGAYNTIERANLGHTRIRKGAKTGNLVYIAHNVSIGRHTRVGGSAGIAGNTFIGNNVLIGPKAGIAQELLIGNNAVIGPKASIIANVPEEGGAFGTPGMSRAAWLRSSSLIPQLPAMKRDIARMSKKIEELQAQINDSD